MPDGKTLISGGKDGSVRFWDLNRTPRHGGALVIQGGPFVSWAFEENQSDLLTYDQKGRVQR
jgi:WD40 repeat protein